MTNFIVTSGDGEISEYKIVAIFSTRPKAEEYINIEEYEIDVPFENNYTIQVTIRKDGRGVKTKTFFEQCNNWDGISYDREAINSPKESRKAGTFTIYVKTKDVEHAIKVANEKRMIILENNAWGNVEKTLELFKN